MDKKLYMYVSTEKRIFQKNIAKVFSVVYLSFLKAFVEDPFCRPV